MTKKSLQAWYNSGDITYNQKEIISKFGVNDYYPEYPLWDLKKLWYWDDILKRNYYSVELIFCHFSIYQMNFFSAWWNNNLLLVLGSIDSQIYFLNLIVYEMPYGKRKEIFETFRVGVDIFPDLSSAKKWAKLKGEVLKQAVIPVFNLLETSLVVSYINDYDSVLFPANYDLVQSQRVKRIELPYYDAKHNPDYYAKPLDIIKIFMIYFDEERREWKDMVHACIYLGKDKKKNKNKICHLFIEKEVEKIAIEDWEELFFVLPKANKMILYHPVVPFKDPKKIIEHVAKCVEGTKRYFSSVAKNNFRLFNSSNKGQSNNCENFSNGCVLGLNYSELAERRQNKEKSEFCLKEEISRTDCNLDKLTDHFPYNTISKIKDYKENDLATGNEMECSIEVQPKTSVFSDMTREMLKRNYGNMYRG